MAKFTQAEKEQLGPDKLATAKVDRPEIWSMLSAILGGISIAVSAFAFSQFNFVQRQQAQQKRADALSSLLFRLRYLDPEKELFHLQYEMVLAWNDFTSLDAQIPLALPQA
jgi:hypothetical protein